MVVELHEHVQYDLLQLKDDDILKAHIKNLLSTSFYNLAVASLKYPDLWEFKSTSGVKILFIKNKASIVIVSIKKQ